MVHDRSKRDQGLGDPDSGRIHALHTGLTSSTPYYYVVTAVTGSGESAESTCCPVSVPGTRLLGGTWQGNRPYLTNTDITVAGSTFGYADCAGTAARFKTPRGITTDGTTLYVTTVGNLKMVGVDIAFGAAYPLESMSYGSAGIVSDGVRLYVSYQATIRKIE